MSGIKAMQGLSMVDLMRLVCQQVLHSTECLYSNAWVPPTVSFHQIPDCISMCTGVGRLYRCCLVIVYIACAGVAIVRFHSALFRKALCCKSI